MAYCDHLLSCDYAGKYPIKPFECQGITKSGDPCGIHAPSKKACELQFCGKHWVQWCKANNWNRRWPHCTKTSEESSSELDSSEQTSESESEEQLKDETRTNKFPQRKKSSKMIYDDSSSSDESMSYNSCDMDTDETDESYHSSESSSDDEDHVMTFENESVNETDIDDKKTESEDDFDLPMLLENKISQLHPKKRLFPGFLEKTMESPKKKLSCVLI